MQRYVALLRGINVGGRSIKMAELRACFEAAGYDEVKTILQSGNVVFTARETETSLKLAIEKLLSDIFHYPAKVQVYTIRRLRDIIDAYPFGQATSDQHDYVIFMEQGLENALISEAYTLAPEEQVTVGPGVVYWRVAKGSTLQSNFAKQLVKPAYKKFNTNRNLRTLQKLINDH